MGAAANRAPRAEITNPCFSIIAALYEMFRVWFHRQFGARTQMLRIAQHDNALVELPASRAATLLSRVKPQLRVQSQLPPAQERVVVIAARHSAHNAHVNGWSMKTTT
jgi:hypothetical protein